MKLIHKDEYIRLFQGDCLEVMDKLINKGIKFNAIITDPPYGTTVCKWDTIIPFNNMWERLNKLIVDNGAMVLFSSQPFTTMLINSNINIFKYEIIWEKSFGTNYAHAPNMPLKTHENILIFSKGKIGHLKQLGEKRMIYNPQGIREGKRKSSSDLSKKDSEHKTWRESHDENYTYKNEGYPRSVIYYSNASNKDRGLHPTQKPLDLLEYLINTYTNENDLILDFTCGSGTTLLAARNLKRKCIGIELEEKYCEIAKNRLIA